MSEESVAPRPDTERRSQIELFAVVVVYVAVFLVIGRLDDASPPYATFSEAPAFVVGSWITEDARYAGRALRVTPDSVEIGRGDSAPPVLGRLVGARLEQEPPYQIVRLDYRAQGDTESIELLIDASGAMRLRHSPAVAWTKR